MNYLSSVTVEAVREKETLLGTRLRDLLTDIPGVRVAVPHLSGSPVLFSIDGLDSEAVAVRLDACREAICVRSGYHCAALAHRTLSTPTGGAVRVSFGWFISMRDADIIAKRVREIAGER